MKSQGLECLILGIIDRIQECHEVSSSAQMGELFMLEFREAIRLVDKENNKYFYFQFVYCSTRLYIRYDLCINTGPADRMIPYRIGPVLTPNLISSCPSPLVDSRVCAPLYLIQRTCRRYSNTIRYSSLTIDRQCPLSNLSL